MTGSMTNQDIDSKFRALARNERRFRPGAYHFILDSLDYVSQYLGKNRKSGLSRHVSVEEFLEGIREYALDEYGPLARVVLEYLGIYSTEDIGDLVFQLVELGYLNRQDTEQKEDFSNGFDFKEVFEENFKVVIPW